MCQLLLITETECVYCAVRAEGLCGFSNLGVCLLRGTSWVFVWFFQPRRSVFTARYELNTCVAFPTEECVYCVVRAEHLFNLFNWDGVCLPRGTSWIFVWLFQPRSVFTARYELNICLNFSTETEWVYCAVRAESLCTILVNRSLC